MNLSDSHSEETKFSHKIEILHELIEEKIIENLNSLANDSVLAVLNISVIEVKDADVPVEVNTISVAPPTQDSGVAVAPVAPVVLPKKLKVTISVVGDYTNLKGLLEKIQKLKK